MVSEITILLLLKLCVLFLVFACQNKPNRRPVNKGQTTPRRQLAAVGNGSLIVQIKNGSVLGVVGETIDSHKPFLAWRGIPYAKPPVGPLRFRPPEPAINWTGVREAKKDGNHCVQTSASGSEDCLFINVYTPKLIKDNDLLPVLVWIYGGAFMTGDSTYDTYGPDYFLNEGVMFVSFNYRLGVFGFLSTEDLVSPGNYGLKDQIFALKWIQDNIGAFGGDPLKVTIFGESAGSASVSYLVQTPLTKGLFRAAIGNSGSGISQWALSRTPKQTAVTIANNLHIDTSTTSKLVEGLRKQKYEILNTIANDVQTEAMIDMKNNILHGLIFSPTIEPQHQGAVLTGKFHQLLKEGKFNRVPYLMGFNSQEAAGWLNIKIFVGLAAGLIGSPYLALYDVDNRRLIPGSMRVKPVNQSQLAALIRRKYFLAVIPITVMQRDLETFVSDDQFARPIHESARLHSVHVPVYYYCFSYLGALSQSQYVAREPNQGVSHAEDLAYMFRQNTSVSTASDKDSRTRYRLVRMWSNFVKYGNPTPNADALLENVTWPKTRESSNTSRLAYLDIGEHLKVLHNPRQDFLDSWQAWFDQYGKPPYDTY